MKKLIIGIVVAAIATTALCLYSTFALAVNVSWDFEDGIAPSWDALYNNADMKIEREDDGNRYLRLSYNGAANRGRKYYDVKVSNVTAEGVLQADYDIMYSQIDTAKDGDIQFKYRTGPGSSDTTMLARVGKTNDYFRVHNETGDFSAIKDLNGRTLQIEPGHWYSIKIIVDFDNCKQSVYVFDRDTQELLSYSEPTGTIDNSKKINMITFSSGTDMCLDNVKIYNISCEKGYIYGSPYVSSGTKNKYYLLGQSSDGSFTALPSGTVEWTLETPRTGVSVESSTGRIIVDSKPEPGPVVLRAEKNGIIAKYVVNVSQ